MWLCGKFFTIWAHREAIAIQSIKSEPGKVRFWKANSIVLRTDSNIIMRSLIKAGFQDRIIMFGSDNGDIVKVVAPVNDLAFLSEEQKKILVGNAQKFFLR